MKDVLNMKDVLAVGNAICDVLVQVPDEVLTKYGLNKGSMSLVDVEKASEILKDLKEHGLEFKVCSGGSAANTTNYISKYGLSASFLGNVAEGFYGDKFSKELEESNIEFFNVHDIGDSHTAKCLILVTEDGERTMCTSLGCASTLHLSNADLDKICAAKIVYVEGYLWDQASTINVINAVMEKAAENNAKIMFSLSDAFCVNRHLSDFKELFSEKLDILFGNEDEFLALFDLPEINRDNLKKMQSSLEGAKTSVLVLTRSKEGCVVITKEAIIEVSTEDQKPVDTTGAGDSFAAGFIYGQSQNMSFLDSAKIANNIAGQVILHLGARPNINLPKHVSDIKKSA